MGAPGIAIVRMRSPARGQPRQQQRQCIASGPQRQHSAIRAAMPLLLVAASSLALAVRAVSTAATGLQQRPQPQQQPPPRDAANATCTAGGCNFYFLCNEGRTVDCCANGTRGPGCVGICPDTHCGQVDAAPSMPKALFEPQFAKELAEYIEFTKGIQIQDPFCGAAGDPNPKRGTCASQGYKYKHANELGRRIAWGGFPHGPNPDFGPSTVLQKACLANCGCCVNTSVLYNPGVLPECASDAPKKVPPCTNFHHPVPFLYGICGVCTPSFNEERFIDFYFTTKVQNVCELRDGGGSDPICSAATNPLACLAHPLKCAWRVPTSSGRCISKGKSTVRPL
jgi:hypothetical protein